MRQNFRSSKGNSPTSFQPATIKSVPPKTNWMQRSPTQGPQHHLIACRNLMHAQVRRVLRQAWKMDAVYKAVKSLPQSRPTFRTRLGGRRCLDPGRSRPDARRNKVRTAAGTAAFARLHEDHRECHGHGAGRVSRNVKYGARLRWLCVGQARPCRKPPRIQASQRSASSFHFSRQRWLFA